MPPHHPAGLPTPFGGGSAGAEEVSVVEAAARGAEAVDAGAEVALPEPVEGFWGRGCEDEAHRGRGESRAGREERRGDGEAGGEGGRWEGEVGGFVGFA